MRTLDQWLSLLEARHPIEIELGLERISAVASQLSLGRPANKVIVVGGTNGKGSCVRALETFALAKGLKVGAYTSPHLLRYNERVRIQGKNVDDGELCCAFEQIDADRNGVPLTYFEVGTLAALAIMTWRQLDLAILEIGLGGRYDAVNIIDADVAVITSIDLDHVDWLGSSREAIALEKAGIARLGKPVVCTEDDPPGTLVAELDAIGAIPYYIGQDFGFEIQFEALVDGVADGAVGVTVEQTVGTMAMWVAGARPLGALGGASVQNSRYSGLPVPTLSPASVVAAVQCFHLLDMPLLLSDLQSCMPSMWLAGRYQKLVHKGRRVIFDVAHNPAAAENLAYRLQSETSSVAAVVALMADKDVDGFIEAMSPAVERWFTGSLHHVKRALSGDALAQMLKDKGQAVSRSGTIEDAFELAINSTAEKNTLVVCGSFFTIAAIMTYLEIDNDL